MNKLTIAVVCLLLVCVGGVVYSRMPTEVAALPLPPMPPHYVVVSVLYEDGKSRLDGPEIPFDLAGCQAEAHTINQRWLADERDGMATCKWVEQ